MMAELIIEKFFPGRGNTRTLIERYMGGGGAGVMYVAPTRRKARQVRDLLLARTGALMGEVVVTFDDLVNSAGRRAADGPVINDAKKLVLVEDALLARTDEARPFGIAADFPGTANRVSNLIAELKQNGIMSYAALAKKASGLGGNVKSINDLVEIYRAYEERKTPGGNSTGKVLLDSEDLAARAASFISVNGINAVYRYVRTLVFDGFYDFNELQKNVLEAVVRSAGQVVFAVETGARTPEEKERYSPVFMLSDGMLDCLRKIDVEQQEKWNEPEEYLRPGAARNLFVSLADFEKDVPNGEKITLMAARDRSEEVRLIAESIKRRMVDAGPGKFDPRKTAVVFPALKKYTQYVREWFPRCGVPFRIEAGEPLNSAAAADMFLAMLETAESGFARTVLFRLLSFPFVSFRKLDKEFGGDGVRFNSAEFDSIAREAQITGGSPGLGAEEWKVKFEKMRESLKARIAGAAAGDDDPEKGGDSGKLLRKYSRVDFYAKCFHRISGWFAPLVSKEKMRPPEYFESLIELMENFGVEEKVFTEEVKGVTDARRAENVMALRGLLDTLGECRSAMELVKGGREMTPSEYGSYVRSAIHGKSLPARSSGEGVAVMGVFETRGLNLNCVYMGGMLDGEFPSERAAPFLFGRRDREALGMRSIRSESAEDKMIFFGLVAGVKDLTVSYPAWEGGKELLRSVFVDALAGGREDDEGENPVAPTDVEKFAAGPESRVYSLPRWLEETGRVVLGGNDTGGWKTLLGAHKAKKHAAPFRNMLSACNVENARAASEFSEYTGAVRSVDLREALVERFLRSGREFSATQLEMYARCPFRFFANYVLKLGAPEEVEEEITPMTVGSLLHDVLCDFYAKRILTTGAPAERVTSANLEKAERQLREIADERIKNFVFTGVFWEREKENILRGLCGEPGGNPGALKDFLLREMDLPEELRPSYFEVGFSDRDAADGKSAAGWSCAVGTETARFRGRVDRIDVAEIGGKKYWIVLDYKSGKPKSINLTLEGIDFQLPLYLLFSATLMKEGDEFAGAVYDYLLGKSEYRGRKGIFARKEFVSNKPGAGALFVSRARTGIFEGESFFIKLRELEGRITQVAESIVSGWFHESPLDAGRAGCEYCDYAALCRENDSTVMRLDNLKNTPEGERVYVPGKVLDDNSADADGSAG